jgi:polysaccharide pyruvyl transferase WcaK-like protein
MVNVGDMAMLAVAVRRLSELWPEALIGVITDSPDRLATILPGAIPVPAAGQRLWFDEPYAGARVHSRLPVAVARALRRRETDIRRRWPRAAGSTIRLRRRLMRRGTKELDTFLEWVSSADLVVASGAGLLTDSYAPRACTTLELLEMALDRGATAAMFGQGVGPLADHTLEVVARRVLPRLDLIGLREGHFGRPILRRLGVSEDRIVVTGDDAIEMVLREAPGKPVGTGIGVGVRVARYAGLQDEQLEAVGAAAGEAAGRHGAELMPVPVSSHWKERDAEMIARVLGRNGSEAEEVSTPENLIERISRCRVVISGSYHGAVFALAQGIPAIGLVGSEYYTQKFGGLSDQFEGGCATVALNEPALAERLGAAIETAWLRGPEQAAQLLSLAKRQREVGRQAYRRLRQIHDAGVADR